MADQFLENFIQWCRDQRDQALQSLAFMERGDLTLYSNHVDISESHMRHLRRVIEEMDAIISDHDSAND